MLGNQFQSDLRLLQAQQEERQREAELARWFRPAGFPSIKVQLFSAMGDLLIAWGQRLKGEMECHELTSDCA